MQKYEDIYIYTDVDGTISTWEYEIPNANLMALKEFTQQGGHFAVATGRGGNGVKTLSCLPYINMPCIMANGAVIADVKTDEIISFTPLPKKAKEVALDVRDKFPIVPIMVWGKDTRFVVSEKEYCKNLPVFMSSVFSSIEKLNEPWAKLVFYLEPEEKEGFMRHLEKLVKGELNISSSSVNYVEVMPKNISKGDALENVIKLYNIKRENLYVAGDFNNDLTMLSLKGVNSFCPLNAEDCVKAVSNEVLCHVDEGIIPQIINRIK